MIWLSEKTKKFAAQNVSGNPQKIQFGGAASRVCMRGTRLIPLGAAPSAIACGFTRRA
jgi:hypothetical protein